MRQDSNTSALTSELQHAADQLTDFIQRAQPLLVLTGAGISTASGIPDYRDANGNWKHAKPVQYRDFMDKTQVYRRYWARSSIGWPLMRNATPNPAHQALARLQQSQVIGTLITQNVDSLHQKAEHETVINMHGHLRTVSCQECHDEWDRDALQRELHKHNADWFETYHAQDARENSAAVKPDGDVELEDKTYAEFKPPYCQHCGGRLKPDVVFFGETIPAQTTQAVQSATEQHSGLLVIGSSLTVFSGFRIAREFHQRKLPFAIINQGVTRADALRPLKLEHDACALLSTVAQRLTIKTYR